MFSVIPVRAISAKSKSNLPNKLAIEYQLCRRKPKEDCKDLVLWGTNSISISRKYSSKVEVQSKRNSNESLDPWFITGFSDGESCFSVIINNNNRYSTGYSLQLNFQILLHKKDRAILEQIQSKWGVGVIKDQPNNDAVNFTVSRLKDIQIVIDHFEIYPLITQKLGDYKLFKQVFNMMKNQEHLTMEGLQKIVAIKAALNWGLSDKLIMAFPDIKYLERLLIVNQ